MQRSLRIYFGVISLVTLMGTTCEGLGNRAELRLVNVSSGYDSLDLYANDDDTDEQQLAAVAYETVSASTELSADTYDIKLKKNGVTSTLLTLSDEQLAENDKVAYVAYGSTGRFAALTIDETEDEPDSGDVKVRALNVAEAGNLDVYLTEESASLDDAEPVFSGVESGSAADITTIDSGTYRLRVVGTGDTSDLRLDISGVALGSEKVISLILTATKGGALVNAMVLEQEGSLTAYKNTKARVRGAVGIANGSAATAAVAGVTVLSNAAAGVISSDYLQVTAGSAAITLSVDGTAVPINNQTLSAGGDYTLLAWDDANGTHASLIEDDNRLPSESGETKIRVLNGISGIGEPINLAVDYSPLVEGISLGSASAYSEIDSGSDYQVDVTSTTTSEPLLSRDSVTLQADSVYTLFMSGGGDAAVNGTLRKDR